MEKKYPKNRILIESIVENLNLAYTMRIRARNEIGRLIFELCEEYGGLNYLAFNDETGYPMYKADDDSCYEDIVAVKVERNEYVDASGMPRETYTIYYNTTATDDGVDENDWFVAEDFGEINEDNLFECVCNWEDER